jgi:hypothetical protein
LLPPLKLLLATAPSCMLTMIALTPPAFSSAAYLLTVAISSSEARAGWYEVLPVSVPLTVRWMKRMTSFLPPPASTHTMLYGGSTVSPLDQQIMLPL